MSTSSTLDEFLQYLHTLPQNLSQCPIPLPDISSSESAIFCEALSQIALDHDSSENALSSILQAAALTSTSTQLEPFGLRWAQSAAVSGAEGEAPILAYLVNGLSEKAFSAERWMLSLGNDLHPDSRLKAVIRQWGKSDLLAFLDACVVAYRSPRFRVIIVQLLIEILLDVPYDPTDTRPSANVLQLCGHPFLDSLLHSLILDTGNHLFSFTLRLLMEIIPYAPLAITTRIPLMIIVLGRVILWRDRPFLDEDVVGGDGFTRTPLPNHALGWQVAGSSAEPTTTLPEILQPRTIAQNYLITLYGAWPSNVIAFVREPVAYIQGKRVPSLYAVEWAKIWAPGILAARIEPMIRDFRLHPSLVVFTSTAELADDKRWDRVDPSEFTARSRALANADRSNVSQFSLMDHDDSNAGSIDVLLDGNQLQRENELLKMEARFTSRVRKQYLHHISRLQDSSLRLNNDEAEIHSFVNRLKEQSKQIVALNEQLASARGDASLAQQRHSKWAAQQHDKVSSFRSEKATWQTEAARIRGDLSEARATIKTQQEELAVVKNERFKFQNLLTEAEPKIRRISDFETRIKQLTESQRLWESDIQRCKQAEKNEEVWKSKCYQLEQMLRTSREETQKQGQQRSVLSAQKSPARKPDFSSTSVVTSSSQTTAPDLSLYVTLLEQSKSRTDSLERQNQELRSENEELKETLRRGGHSSLEKSSSLWEYEIGSESLH